MKVVSAYLLVRGERAGGAVGDAAARQAAALSAHARCF